MLSSSCSRCHLSTLQYPPESLASKGMSDSLKDVLDTTVKMVNFVKARSLNSHVFSILCNDMGSDHVTLLQHTEERKVLTHFF